jgi:hypothetical protein
MQFEPSTTGVALCFTSFDDCRNLDYNKLTALPANVFAQAPAVVTLYVPEIEFS